MATLTASHNFLFPFLVVVVLENQVENAAGWAPAVRSHDWLRRAAAAEDVRQHTVILPSEGRLGLNAAARACVGVSLGVARINKLTRPAGWKTENEKA